MSPNAPALRGSKRMNSNCCMDLMVMFYVEKFKTAFAAKSSSAGARVSASAHRARLSPRRGTGRVGPFGRSSGLVGSRTTPGASLFGKLIDVLFARVMRRWTPRASSWRTVLPPTPLLFWSSHATRICGTTAGCERSCVEASPWCSTSTSVLLVGLGRRRRSWLSSIVTTGTLLGSCERVVAAGAASALIAVAITCS